ncbi:uncharacterized protein yc1106_07084 [Curvularia clavata]|uniref:Uncharacterized protein n=1 Tax=Curvularia clavata TaxID=95742 RepID=A0A9Q9DVA2_CURCL|nr:uncharacterized protein yc1106_07084 [Curvularia clavata]
MASYPTFNPVPLSARTFEHDHSFDGDPHDDKGPWEGLIPTGRGFVRVSDPSEYGLSPGVPLGDEFPKQQGYLVSMYHQLHCIAVLKKTIIEAQDPENRPTHFSKLNVTLLGNIELEHSHHCVEYLRQVKTQAIVCEGINPGKLILYLQAILCAGDLTLEPAEFIDGKISHAVSGWGVKHVCRNSDFIFDMVSERAVNNASGVTA